MNYLKRKMHEAKEVASVSILDVLYKRLAEEYLQQYQYEFPVEYAVGLHRQCVVDMFDEHAEEEEGHAKKLLKRISELDGDPSMVFNPERWNEIAECKYVEPKSPFEVMDLLYQNKGTEEKAIEGYKTLVAMAREQSDFTTEKLGKEILEDEEHHLREIKDLIADYEAIMGKYKTSERPAERPAVVMPEEPEEEPEEIEEEPVEEPVDAVVEEPEEEDFEDEDPREVLRRLARRR